MKLTFLMKAAQAAALVIAICFTLGATNASERVDKLSHRLTCTCGGCSQLLGECDHAGCSGRDEEFHDLSEQISSGATDKEIMAAFSSKYGATVLAAPTMQGFDLVAWIAPVAVFLAALFGVLLVARHWAATRPQIAAAQQDTPEMAALREKIRRETGADGGI